MITVAVAEASAMLRAGVRTALERDAAISVAEAASLDELVAITSPGRATLALVDLRLPPDGGIAALERIRRPDGPQAIVWSFDPTPDDVLAGIAAGARGYVRKEIAPEGLLAAVRAVASGEAWLQPDLVGLLVGAVQSDRGAELAREALLSGRERHVLELVSAGLRNRDIASELAISEFTVKRHVQNILRKLELPSRRAAAARYGPGGRRVAA